VRARLLGIAILVTALAAACSSGVERASEALGTTPTATAHPTSPDPTASGSSATSTTPTPAMGRAIVVESPLPGDQVISPAVVRGRAVSADGHVVVRVLDVDGNELSAMNAPISCGVNCRGVFRVPMAFFAPAQGPGTIQIYELGPDGEPAHVVEVPVTLVPGV
jgi:Immunoglobulin-like domain of bacterial spore germination